MFASATLSLGGISGAVANTATQETDPLQGENVSVSLGNVTTVLGRATLSFDGGTMQFRGRDWTIEGEESILSGDTVRVTVDDVSAETYSMVRVAMVEAVEGNSLLPLVNTLAMADINPDAPVRMSVSPVEQNGQLIATQITATGRFAAVVPEGLGALAASGRTLEGTAEVGPSEWDRLTVQQGDSELVFDGVVMTIRPPGADEKARDAEIDLRLGTVTRDGETLVSDFQTSGTLAELLQVLPTRRVEAVGDAEGRLPKELIVSSPGTDELLEYTFEVTGDLIKLEPGEDSGPAVDEVTETNGRVRVEGAVSTGDDRFAFSGDLIEIDVPPQVQLEVQERN